MMKSFLNSTNFTYVAQRTEPDRDGSRLAYFTVEVGIAIAGLIANLMVVATILFSSKLRSVNYHFILNLSISDLGMLLFTFPFAVNIQEGGEWPEFVCYGILPVSDMFQGVSFWTITAIAISRYRTVCGDFNIKRNTLRKTKCTIASIWVVSFVLVSLPLVVVMKHVRKASGGICYPDFPEITGFNKQLLKKIYIFTIRVTLNYLLPLAIIAATYIVISVQITKTSHQLQCMIRDEAIGERSVSGIRVRSALKRNRRAKKLLTPLVLVFSLTVLPFNLLRVLQFVQLDISNYERKTVWIVCLVFLISHCAINPLIYCIVNPDFYREMKKLHQNILQKIRVSWTWLSSGSPRQEQEECSMQLNPSHPRESAS